MKEYIVQYESSYQFTENNWKVYHPTLKVTDETTIQEIKDWYNSKEGKSKLEVRLIEL